MRRSLSFAVLVAICLVPLFALRESCAQTYISAVGNPSFGVNVPVPNGFINIANGNLHLEIPLATHKQRGALQLNERLVYDSRIWEIVHYSGYYWWPINIPNSSAGWRFIKGNETGTLGTASSSRQQLSCTGSGAGTLATSSQASPNYSGPGQTYYYYAETTYYNWTDPSGTVHPFDTPWYSVDPIPFQCDRSGYPKNPTPRTATGYATDASGYAIRMSGTGDGSPTSITVLDNAGTQVYPQVIDRFGNYWTNDGSGNLVDDLGRTPVITTTNGNVTYYDVLAANGPISNNGTRVRYTVTTTQVTIYTQFNQSGVTEYQNNNAQPATIPAIQSVGLPDGSSYQFGYDSYGEITSVTLPTGGVVQYGWTNYLDSYQNVNRWVSQSTVGSGTTTYTPSVLTQCASNGTGCKEQVNLHRPSGDETVYTMTLNNGAWDTNTTVYAGAASANQAKLATVNTYDFSQPCTIPGCNGAQNITRTYETDSLPDANLSSQTQRVFADPKTGHMTSQLEWDFYPTGSTPSASPTRQVNYVYTGFDLTSETRLDASGNTASSTTYNYTSSATPTSGVVGHGSANAGGPYLTSVVAANNAPAGSITTSSTYDDTGAMLTTTDGNGNPVTTYQYDPTHTFVTEIDKPSTSTNGTPFSHVSKASFDSNSGALLSTDDENSVAHGQANTVRYSYDTAGRPQQVSNPDGGSVTYSYPSATETDTTVAQSSSVSTTTVQTVDGYGRAYQATVGGITTTKTYDGNGRVASVTNPQTTAASPTDGTTYTSYDALDRVSSIVYPGGGTANSQVVGNTMTLTDEVGSRRQQTFNAFGELVSVLEPDPNTGALALETDYQHDALGNVICIEQHGNTSGTGCSAPASSDATSAWRVRRFFYNQLSQLRAASIPEHTAPGAGARQNCGAGTGSQQWTDCYFYDNNGNRTRTVDNRGVTRTSTYDALNRPLLKTSPQGTTVDLSYDGDSLAWNAVGRLWHESNDVNAASTYGYDVMGRLITESSCRPSNCATSYVASTATYDLAGNRTSLTYPDGRVVGSSYDNVNRLSAVTYRSWGSQPVGTTYWTATAYAPPGEITASQFGGAMQMQAGFDGRSSLTSLNYSSTNSGSPQTYFNKTYQWDRNAVNLLEETDQRISQGRQYDYDKMNRLASAVDVTATASNATGTATITGVEGSYRDCSGGGGLATSQSAQAQPGRCVTVWDTGTIAITVGGFTVSTPYQRGSTAAQLAASLTSMLNGSGSPVTATVSGTTIGMTSTATGAAANYSLSYTSDGDFNANFSGSTLTGGTSAAPIAGGFNQQYTLDAWGNLSSMGTSGFSQPVDAQNRVSSFSYDAAGRLLNDSVTSYGYDDDGMLLNSSDGASYVYDALGARAQVARSGNSTEYYYFAGQLLATLNPATGAWTDTIYAGGRIAEVAGTQNASPVYSVLDHLGSEVAAVDGNGNLVSRLDYAPFGQQLSGSNPDPYIFTGLEHDASGLDHATFRQYSAATARWTIPDPYDGSYNLADPQSLNRYAYVGNKPLALVDPSGLEGFFEEVEGYIFNFGEDEGTFKGNTRTQSQGKLLRRVNPDGSLNYGPGGPDGPIATSSGSGLGGLFHNVSYFPVPSNSPLSPQAQACANKIQGAVNSALNTNSTYLGPTVGPGVNSMGYRNGAYNFNFFALGVTNPVAGSNGGSGRFPGSGLHIPLPGGQDPTISPWGYIASAGGSYFTAHYDSANPTDDLISFFEHIINDVILRRPHGC